MLTIEQLRRIMPNLRESRAAEMLPLIVAAAREFSINTPLRLAAWLAQIAHESGELRYVEEIASGEAYEGREDLGNRLPGDGKRYKGRGPIMITGADNYALYGELLGLPLLERPELAALPQVGFRIAGAFWTRKKLNAYADKGLAGAVLHRTVRGKPTRETVPAFDVISFRVNGGWNGRADRMKYYRRALVALGAGGSKA